MLLQKKDSEGFGFVLRGAKGETCEMNANLVTTLFDLFLIICDTIFPSSCSPDAYRGVHPHPGLPRPAVLGVSGRGRRRLESRPQDGRLPHRGSAMFHLFALPFKTLAYFFRGFSEAVQSYVAIRESL